MVKISHVALVAALTSFVAATPIPEANNALAIAPLLKERGAVELSIRDNGLGDLLDLIAEVVEFVVNSLGDVLTLNLGDISNQVHTLLDDVNNYLGQLGQSLGQISLDSGLIGDLQKTLLGGSLSFLLLQIGTLLSHIVGVINPHDLSGQLITDLQGLINQLNVVLTGITATLGDFDNLPSIISSLLGDVSSVISS
jgi:hypothetical protein